MSEAHSGESAPVAKKEAEAPMPKKTVAVGKSGGGRKLVVWGVVGLLVAGGLVFGLPRAIEAFNTVSTEDAYVNGHVTFVAPRVPGQVAKVYVDDNNRVKKGDLLLQLDKKPYDVQVAIAQAAVKTAEDEAQTVTAQSRGTGGADAQPAVRTGALDGASAEPGGIAACEGGGVGLAESVADQGAGGL